MCVAQVRQQRLETAVDQRGGGADDAPAVLQRRRVQRHGQRVAPAGQLGLKLQHRQPQSGLQQRRHHRREQPDHAEMLARQRRRPAPGIAAARHLQPGALDQPARQRAQRRPRHHPARAARGPERDGQRQRVRARERLGTVAEQQRLVIVVEHDVGGAGRAVVELEQAELAAAGPACRLHRLARRQVQRAHLRQREALGHRTQRGHQFIVKAHGAGSPGPDAGTGAGA